jgi:hypothetical protein
MITILIIGVALFILGIHAQSRDRIVKSLSLRDVIVLAGELFIVMTLDDLFAISRALGTISVHVPDLFWQSCTILIGLLIFEGIRRVLLGRKYVTLFST